MINPVNHARTAGSGRDATASSPTSSPPTSTRSPPHTGRGGWTWYTGSAGWMYRLIVESLLGVELAVDKLRIAPCLPAEWKDFKLHYRFRETVYRITVTQASPADRDSAVWLDGELQADNAIPLVDDRIDHLVDVVVHPRLVDAPA